MFWFYNKHGRPVQIANRKPINLSRGGMIDEHPNTRIEDVEEDTIQSLLEVGSLVIPRPVMERGYMNGYPFLHRLRGKEIKDPSRLVPVVVMSRELIVPKANAGSVKKWLEKRGVTLPIPEDF